MFERLTREATHGKFRRRIASRGDAGQPTPGFPACQLIPGCLSNALPTRGSRERVFTTSGPLPKPSTRNGVGPRQAFGHAARSSTSIPSCAATQNWPGYYQINIARASSQQKEAWSVAIETTGQRFATKPPSSSASRSGRAKKPQSALAWGVYGGIAALVLRSSSARCRSPRTDYGRPPRRGRCFRRPDGQARSLSEGINRTFRVLAEPSHCFATSGSVNSNRSACGDSVRGRTFIAEAGIHSMRTKVTLEVLCAAAPMLFSAGAIAQDANGRFTMTPTPEGFLKLDSRTGVVSQCLRQGPNYECRLIPDERAALQDEIDRLTRENAELRNRTAGLSPPSTGTAPPKAGEANPGSPQQSPALG